MNSTQQTPTDFASVQDRFDFLRGLTNQEIYAALKKNNDRQENKEKSYDMEIKFAELQDTIVTQPINQEELSSRINSLEDVRNDENRILLGLLQDFYGTEKPLPEAINHLIAHLENKDMLATKNIISSYSGKLHPRGIFNLYNPVYRADEKISAYNNGYKQVECELRLRTLYFGIPIKKYQNGALLEIDYEGAAAPFKKGEPNGLISNAMRLSANQLAVDFCRKKGYKIIEYYQSSPNFYCYVEPIGITEDQSISSFHYGEAIFS